MLYISTSSRAICTNVFLVTSVLFSLTVILELPVQMLYSFIKKAVNENIMEDEQCSSGGTTGSEEEGGGREPLTAQVKNERRGSQFKKFS